jgi:sugar lactone lactonase YvrE
VAVACGGSQTPAEGSLSPPQPAPTASAQPVQSAAPAAPQPEPAAPAPVLRYAEGLATPESVLYDEPGDRYLVSNINGKPLDKDDNGYIAELSPDGKVTKGKFIAAGANKVKLDAPKGLGIAAGVLYVADITVVRKFDATSGAPKGEVPIAGATFLNDVAVAPDGRVFVSDSGLKAGKDGFEPTGTDAVYVIEKGKVKTLAKSKELGSPNGITWTDQGLLVVTFGTDEVYRLDKQGKREQITKLPTGSLDGIFASGNTLFISSWNGEAVYRGTLGGKFEVAVANLKAPADIGFDSKRKRLLVPRFMDNVVEVYDIAK